MRRLDQDTRDAILFLIGCVGLIQAQVLYNLFKIEPNDTLTYVWVGFAGGAIALRIIEGIRGVLNNGSGSSNDKNLR